MSDMQSSQPVQHNPLVHLQLQAARDASAQVTGIVMRERPFIGELQLDAEPDDHALLIALGEVMGVAQPLAVNRITCLGRLAILWLAPQRWLVLTPPGAQASAAQALTELFGRDIRLTARADGGVHAQLSAAAIDYVLASDNTCDLRDQTVQRRQAGRHRLQQEGVRILTLADTRGYDIIMRRNGADALWAWLQQRQQAPVGHPAYDAVQELCAAAASH